MFCFEGGLLFRFDLHLLTFFSSFLPPSASMYLLATFSALHGSGLCFCFPQLLGRSVFAWYGRLGGERFLLTNLLLEMSMPN